MLGISLRTVRSYNATGHAPKVACLAVFWLTTWGRSAVNAQAINDAVMAISCVEGLKSEVQQLRAQLEHLLLVGDFGSANDPAIGNPSRPPHSRLR